MPVTGALDVIWWITVVEIPALAGLFWLVFKTRTDTANQFDGLKQACHLNEDKIWAALNAYKLDVATTYVSHQHLQQVETRLIRHLVRIEDKLDSVFKPAAAGVSHDRSA